MQNTDVCWRLTNYGLSTFHRCLALVCFVVMGCKGGEVSISQLSSELPAPSQIKNAAGKLSGCANQYTEFTGACSMPISDFEVSLDQSTWENVPAEMPIYNSDKSVLGVVPLTAALSCGNGGVFKFAVSSTWLAKIFGTNVNSGNKIYLRGSYRGRKTSLASSTILDSASGVSSSCVGATVLKSSHYLLRGQVSSGAGSRQLQGSSFTVKGSVKHVVR